MFRYIHSYVMLFIAYLSVVTLLHLECSLLLPCPFHLLLLSTDFDWQSVCNVIFLQCLIVSILHVYVCVEGRLARSVWKTRPPPKTVIILIEINQIIIQSLLALSLLFFILSFLLFSFFFTLACFLHLLF